MNGVTRARAMASFIVALSACAMHAAGASMSPPDPSADMFKAYRGLYRAAPNHMVGIDAFIADDGTPTMLFADYQSGIVRRLFARSDFEFVMGPNFNVESPIELTVMFLRDGKGDVTGITLQPAGAATDTALRVPLEEEAVVFRSADATLSGTLIIPEGNHTRPAIVLLHGSGPLTRYSFGPYPHFFVSLGFAVLIYDKRGAGRSTGPRVDASTGRAMAPECYPEGLSRDALAALHFLQSHRDIDPEHIGLWGSSEGGMLATQVAARAPQVAFAINSSGFMGPLWQTTLYQAAAIPRRDGVPETDVRDFVTFTEDWLDVARTGHGWERFLKRREEIRRKSESALFWSSGEFTSVEEMRWYWDHVLSFSPLPALRKVKAPVLGLFGEVDPFTEATVAGANMRRTLTEAGNHDVSVKIFPEAGHSLSLAAGGRMAPGVFGTLRSWLLARVHIRRSAG